MKYIILEKYINIDPQDVEQKKKYLKDVEKILSISYGNIGGPVNISSYEELLEPKYFWKLNKRDGKIVALCIYKVSNGGRKISLCGCDGTPEGKERLYALLGEDVTQEARKTWGEFSGAIEHIYKDKLGATIIPNYVAKEILNKLGKDVISLNPDGVHYTRIINGNEVEKVMLGNVPQEDSLGKMFIQESRKIRVWDKTLTEAKEGKLGLDKLNGYVSKEYIDNLKESSIKEDVNQDISTVSNAFGTTKEPFLGPSYILPNGKFLKIRNADINISNNGSGDRGLIIHLDVQKWINKQQGKEEKYVDDIGLEEKCIRVNTDQLEHYIVLPKERPNDKQLKSLRDWIDFFYAKTSSDLVLVSYYGPTTTYFKGAVAEDIIEDIKNYYARGMFFENLKEYMDEVTIEKNGEDFPVFVTDETYRLKNLLVKGDKAYRIYNDDETYYFQDAAGNKTHYEMLRLALRNGWLANSKLRYGDDDNLTSGSISPESYDEGYMVFIPFNYNKKLRYHTRLGDDGYYNCRVYPFGVMFVRISDAYENGLFSALGEPDKEIYYDEQYETTIVKSGNNTREFDVYLELQGDPNNAVDTDVMNLRPKEDAKASRDAKMQKSKEVMKECGVPEKLWGKSGQELYFIVRDFMAGDYDDSGFISKEDAKAIVKYLNKMNFSDVPKIEGKSLQEKIVKKGSKWQVQSEKGKNLGTYDTKKEAEDRLKQVHYFKHVNEETFNKDIEIPTPISRENLPDEVICYRTITNDEFYRLFSGDVIEGQWIPDDNDWVHFDNLTNRNAKIILFYTDYYRFRLYKNRITLKCKFNKKDIVAVAKGRYAVAKNFNKTKSINKEYYRYDDDMVFLDEIGVLSYDLSNVLEIVSIKGSYSTNEFPHIFNSDINAKLKQNADKYNIKYDNIKENLNEANNSKEEEKQFFLDYVDKQIDDDKSEINKSKRQTSIYLYDDKIESLQEDLQETDNEGNVLSKEQIEFFKNSKIRDNQGRLIVCYHGTSGRVFDTFDKDRFSTGAGDVDFGAGFYFTKSKNNAKSYADIGADEDHPAQIFNVYLNITNPLYIPTKEKDLIPMFKKLNIELNNKALEEINNSTTGVWSDYFKSLICTIYNDNQLNAEQHFTNDLVKNGYDGVVFKDEIVAFEPNQIKSIDNKNPTNSNNINESLDEFDSIVKTELDVLNRWLDKYGFEVKLITDKETLDDIDWSSQYGDDAVGMFLGEIQDNASIFPIALNKKVISELCKEDSYDEYSYRNELMYGIRGTLWHEAGHGIYRYLEDFYEMPEDEEDCVEEFARYREVSELFDILQDYMKQEESLQESIKHVDEDKHKDIIFKIDDTENINDNLTYVFVKVGIYGDNYYLPESLFVEYNNDTKEVILDTNRQCNKSILSKINYELNLGYDYVIKQLTEFIIDKKDSIERFNKAHKLLGEELQEVILSDGAFEDLSYIRDIDSDYIDVKELEDVTYKQLLDSDLVTPIDKLYHSTPISNLESIKQNGLRIDNKNLWSMSKSGRIYLALNPEESIDYIELAYQWGALDVEDVVLLEIPLSALDLNKLYIDTNEDENGYCVDGKLSLMSLEYRDNIPASNIKIVKTIKEEQDENLNESKQDFEKFRQWCGNDELYNKFMKLRPRLANIRFTDGSKGDDIYFWMKNNTPKDLEDTLQDLEVTPTKKEREKRAQEGAKLLYNQDGWKVFKIETLEASQKYGRNTLWCISGQGGYDACSYWSGHEDCTYFYIDTKNNKKYALIWKKGDIYWTIYNELDEIIPYIPNAPRVEGLPDVSILPKELCQKIAKVLGINASDIIDIKSADNDPEIMDAFIDYDSRENYIVDTKDKTYYIINERGYKDITQEVEEFISENEL